MRFSTIQGVVLAVAGLTQAQTCPLKTVDFEDLKNVPVAGLGPGASLVPNGYSGLNWENLYGVQPSIAAQFLLPQGKMHVQPFKSPSTPWSPTHKVMFTNRNSSPSFAVAPNSPSTIPPVISATTGTTFAPKAIFLGTFNTGVVSGAAALSTASTITVTATFLGGATAQTAFDFNPPNTVFGLAINAEALQYFQFPCAWVNVVSLSFKPQAKNGVNIGMGLAIDNLQLV
ncbi:hypothetical protein Daus18300_001386 [Diaporthe australafricana]|uniref:Uncharacterized protein n=1 Tax=Diaporthe australafricana TaxID=127596 RepID=A0ABR3XVJ4_9PEZI